MSELITIEKILSDWLDKNGYDGLANRLGECGCEKGDLFPCDDDNMRADCVAGHKVMCPCPQQDEDCEGAQFFHEGQWCMFAGKKEPTNV